MGITAGSREVLGRNACDKRQPYRIIIIIIIIIIMKPERWGSLLVQEKYWEEMLVTRDIHII